MAKFSALKDLKREKGEQPLDTPAHSPREQEARPVVAVQPEAVEPVQRAQPAKIGKRNNPAYVQRTAYIRKTTDRAVKRKLFEQGSEKEFSELVDELLSQWVGE